ncbi:MAG: flap endonuclease-1 [Candidatus Aenigmatarchaeota archaeon]|nr:MAG: flap endonuclease-1 [Candidatus Aenigmarchaeota archaeon]
MGVSLSELVPAKQIEFEDLQGKTIAIDAYNVLYQFLTTIRDRFTGEPLRDSKGRITSHLSGLFYRTAKLIENGMEIVYVFDGEPPEFKKETVEQRSETRKEAKIKWKEALERGDTEAVRRYSQAAARLTDEMVAESKRLLNYMGVPWLQAPSEGEAQVAYLVRKGKVWSGGSQDWDSLLFGAPRLVRNLTISGRRKLPGKEKYIIVKPEIVELDKVLSSLGINHDQLITLGILVGTDYNPGGIKGIGPKTALKIVKEKTSPEKAFKDIEWGFKIKPEEIFDFFKNPPVQETDIEKKDFQPEKLLEMLCEEHSFSHERINSVVEKLREGKEKEKQSRLGRFLG